MIGVAHPKWDERPLLVVVKKAGQEVTQRGAAQVLRGQDRQVVDARRRGVRRPSCRTPPPASSRSSSCASSSRTTSCRAEGAAWRIAEEKLEKALRSAHTRARDQQQRLRWTAWTASSYALDTLFLALFWLVGTIPAAVPLGYGLAGAAVCGTVFAVLANGRNLRLRDPNMGVPQIGAAVLLQLAVVAAAPQLAFPFLANLFTVFAFGMTWAPVRQAAVVWSLGVLALGGAVLRHGRAARASGRDCGRALARLVILLADPRSLPDAQRAGKRAAPAPAGRPPQARRDSLAAGTAARQPRRAHAACSTGAR